MSKVKEQAISDIKQDLERDNKCFIAYHQDLDPVMGKLVRDQLRQQSSLGSVHTATRANSQLVAHCFFCKGEVKYTNYGKYYDKQ